jgi:hypothetical protein
MPDSNSQDRLSIVLDGIRGLLADHAEPSGDEPCLRKAASPHLAIRERSRTSSRRS